MAIRIPSLISNAKQFHKLLHRNHNNADVRKGHLVVYVGEIDERKRYVVPISCLNHPSFRDLLRASEEEYGFHHPMGGLTIPCSENAFLELTSRILCLS